MRNKQEKDTLKKKKKEQNTAACLVITGAKNLMSWEYNSLQQF